MYYSVSLLFFSQPNQPSHLQIIAAEQAKIPLICCPEIATRDLLCLAALSNIC